MDTSEHVIDGRIRYRYPTPIAAPYRLARISKTSGLRLVHLLGTIDETVRFLCWILLADYLSASELEPRDDAVEAMLATLEAPTTRRLVGLLQALASAQTPGARFVEELAPPLRGPLGEVLVHLVTDAGQIRIERDRLDLEAADTHYAALLPRVLQMLAALPVLEELLVVRPEPISEDGRTWYLHPWRGSVAARPIVVHAPELSLDLHGAQALLIRPGIFEALQLDPFVSTDSEGRLLSFLRAPTGQGLHWEHYPSGTVQEGEIALKAALIRRAAARIPLYVDAPSGERLSNVAVPREESLSGYRDIIDTATGPTGDHFRGVWTQDDTVHAVVRAHAQQTRDPRILHERLETARRLAEIDHPNLACPKAFGFDAATGCFVVGTPAATHGRLLDRLSLGVPLPLGWSLGAATDMVAGLVALEAQNVHLSTLPAWAVSVGDHTQIVPFLACLDGVAADGPRLVGTLLYQMLTGIVPRSKAPVAPSVLRRGISPELDDVCLGALSGRYPNAEALSTALRRARRTDISDEPELSSTALQRGLAHLQRLRPGALERLRHVAVEQDHAGEQAEALLSFKRIIETVWAPEERLYWGQRLQEALEASGASAASRQDNLRRLAELAPDDLATLQFIASTSRDALRGADLKRLLTRIVQVAHTLADRQRGLEALASLCEERQEPEEARRHWRCLADADPHSMVGWTGLARVSHALGDSQVEGEALEAAIRCATEPASRRRLMMRLAVLRTGTLADLRGAAELLWELVEATPESAEIWRLLRDTARETSDDHQLIRALDGLAACPGLEVPERSQALLEAAIALGLRDHRTDEALARISALLEQVPQDAAALSYRATILERSGHWLEAAEALEAWAETAACPETFGVALKRLARVVGEQLGDTERAVELYQGVLETNPEDPEALSFLERHYRQGQDWAALAQVLETQVDLARGRTQRLRRLEDLATLEADQLSDNQAAFHTWGQLLREDPRHPEALGRVVALADDLQAWEAAKSILEPVLPHVPADIAAELKRRLGLAALDGATDVSAALSHFRAAVAERPTDIPTLEGLLDATARVGEWEEHAGTLRRLADLGETPASRVERLLALATTLRDRVMSAKRAAAVFEEVLAVDSEELAALEGLVQVGGAAGRSAADRVEVLRRWVALCPDPAARLEGLEQLAGLGPAAGLLPQEVARVFSEIVALDPASPVALEGLEQYQRSIGNWGGVCEVLEERVATAGHGDRAALLVRLIGVQLSELGEPEAARQTLDRLMAERPGEDVDPDLVEAVYGGQGAWRELFERLGMRADGAIRESDRAEFLFRQGRVALEELGEEAQAIKLLERTVANAPSHLGALTLLSQVYVEREAWPEAKRVLEPLVGALDGAEPPPATERMVEAWSALGEARERQGEDDRAVEAFEAVLAMVPTSPRARLGLARIAWERQDYEAADRHYRDVLTDSKAQLEAAEVATIEKALGEIALVRGDDANSRRLLERAVASAPDDRAAMRDLALLCERQEDWGGAATWRARLVPGISDPLERFAALVELAAVQRDRLGNHPDAMRALEEARRLRPDSIATQVQLLDAYLHLERFADAVEVLEGLCAGATDPLRKAKYTFTLALLYRDQLHEPRKAVAFLNETLDNNPDKLEAFEAIDSILSRHKDWKGQSENYRVMLERIKGRGNRALEFSLLKNLAHIYQSGLGQPERALTALEAALERQPDAVEVREKLALAYEAQDGGSERALKEYKRLVVANPEHATAWKAMGRLFARQRNRDAAWNVCGVLKVLGQADKKEAAFYARYQKPTLALRKALQGIEHWERCLFAHDQEVLLGRILGLVSRALGPQLALRDLAELGLGPQDAVSLKQKSRFTSFLGTVSKVLQVPVPAVYRSPQARGIRKEPLSPPVMIVGPEVLTGRKGKELRFLLGKALAYFLPPHTMAGAMPVGHLRTLLLGAMRVSMPEASQAGEPGVRGVQKQLEAAMSQRDMNTLRSLCLELTDRPTPPNLHEWLKQVERTANHAGHLLCDDLEVSARMIREEREHGQQWSRLSVDEAVIDLCRYVASERFLTLRREVGAAILE